MRENQSIIPASLLNAFPLSMENLFRVSVEHLFPSMESFFLQCWWLSLCADEVSLAALTHTKLNWTWLSQVLEKSTLARELHITEINPQLRPGKEQNWRTLKMNDLYVRMLVTLEAVKELINREEGQDLVEYALLVSLLSVAAIAFLPALSDAVQASFTAVEADL